MQVSKFRVNIGTYLSIQHVYYCVHAKLSKKIPFTRIVNNK